MLSKKQTIKMMRRTEGVFEILKSLQDIQKKAAEKEAREKAERGKRGPGLSERESAELEAKKLEILRLESLEQGNVERQASQCPPSVILALCD